MEYIYTTNRLPRWHNSKESTCQYSRPGEAGLIPRLGRFPGVGHGNPLHRREWQLIPAFWTGEPCGQRSLADYSPQGPRLDTTEVTQHASTFLSEKSHGQRSLAGYSPGGCKEFNTAEQLHTHTHTQYNKHGQDQTEETRYMFISCSNPT